MARIATCPLCEASCGILVDTRGEHIHAIRGDEDDPFSRGYICPKAAALADLHEDPDRLRAPLIREGARWRQVSWDAALDRAAAGLMRIRHQHGRDSVGGVLRQSGRTQPGIDDARTAVRARAPDEERVFGELGRPAPADARRVSHVRSSRPHSGPRSRSDRLLPGLRREPGGVERQPDDRPWHEEPTPCHSQSRRARGRSRSTTYRDRRDRRCAYRHPARGRCAASRRDAARGIHRRDGCGWGVSRAA